MKRGKWNDIIKAMSKDVGGSLTEVLIGGAKAEADRLEKIIGESDSVLGLRGTVAQLGMDVNNLDGVLAGQRENY